MKILISMDMSVVMIKNIISIKIEIDEEADEFARPYMIMAKDINGDELYLGSYWDENTANRILDDIMYWTVDDNNDYYLMPNGDDFKISNKPHVFYSDKKDFISKVSSYSKKGAECIKAQDGTLIFLNNISFLKDFDLSEYSEEDDEEQWELRSEFFLENDIKSIIFAKNIRNEMMLLGQFKKDDTAANIIDDLYLRCIWVIPQDSKEE
jgi:hypothetical protein